MIQVELALIGALLTSKDAYFKMEIELQPEMFENPDLGLVFQAMRQLADEGIDIDMVMVEEYMRRINPKRYTELNGLSFAMTEMTNVRHDGNVRQYAHEVYRLYRFRTLAGILKKAALQSALATGEPDEVVAEVDRCMADFMNLSLNGNEMKPLKDVLTEAYETHEKRASGELKMALMCGLEEIDFVTGGFHPGELIVLAGRPSEGKTAVALQMSLNIARSGHHVCFFSLEMSNFQMANRVFLNFTRVAPQKLRSVLPDRNDMQQLDKAVEVGDLPFYLDYTAGSSLEAIRRKAFQRSRKGQCDLVVIDYLHLITGARSREDSQDQYIGRIINSLKRLAKELNCPVLVLSQMNRQCEKRADHNYLPQMADLRDSGNIEQAADTIMFIYRLARRGIEVDPVTGEPTEGMGKILIAKNRNGSVGFGRFRHNESFTRITNYIIPHEQQMQLEM